MCFHHRKFLQLSHVIKNSVDFVRAFVRAFFLTNESQECDGLFMFFNLFMVKGSTIERPGICVLQWM